ncbi:hypothetical protein [Lichenibacterium dinghuense]|uniref:hypothetical protein n=1 Tax=Lichenibacterium dinghuense TaxID=2895977 RepID=UPI001F44267D|nr:hypothetical protein [Lichenibacterium sp. 6Y81]
MTLPANRGLRRGLAAVLMLALTLGGLGRAVATAAPSAAARAVIAGVAAPICHSGAGEAPARDASHDCCDDGALLAAAVLPAPPRLVRPAPAARSAARAAAAFRAPVVARLRDHRLPRGPPAA